MGCSLSFQKKNSWLHFSLGGRQGGGGFQSLLGSRGKLWRGLLPLDPAGLCVARSVPELLWAPGSGALSEQREPPPPAGGQAAAGVNNIKQDSQGTGVCTGNRASASLGEGQQDRGTEPPWSCALVFTKRCSMGYANGSV